MILSAPSADGTQIAVRWLEAVNRRDKSALLSLSHVDIKIHGPRGTATGHGILGQWFDGTLVRATPQAAFTCGSTILILHRMEWLNADGSIKGTTDNASIFDVSDGLVTSYERDDDGAGASKSRGFSEKDRIALAKLNDKANG